MKDINKLREECHHKHFSKVCNSCGKDMLTLLLESIEEKIDRIEVKNTNMQFPIDKRVMEFANQLKKEVLDAVKEIISSHKGEQGK
jgi:hypothetical protein